MTCYFKLELCEPEERKTIIIKCGGHGRYTRTTALYRSSKIIRPISYDISGIYALIEQLTRTRSDKQKKNYCGRNKYFLFHDFM